MAVTIWPLDEEEAEALLLIEVEEGRVVAVVRWKVVCGAVCWVTWFEGFWSGGSSPPSLPGGADGGVIPAGRTPPTIA